MFHPFNIIRNIWGFLLLLAKIRWLTLIISKNRFGLGFRAARKGSYPKLERGSWLRWWSNLSQFTWWVFSSYRLACARILKLWFKSFCQVMVTRRKFIGLNGVLFVLLNLLEVWAFRISKSLTMLCLQNWFGIFSITKKLYCAKFLVLSISQMVVFSRLLYIRSVLMCGGVFYKHKMLSTKEQFGGWGMEN